MRGRFLLAVLFLAISGAAGAQTDGPLHAAVISASRTTPLVMSAPPSSPSTWRTVVGFAPGTEIILALSGGPAMRRTTVTADDASLIVLNLTSGALSDTARMSLVTMAVRTPDRFRSLESGSVRLVEGSVMLSADGLFVGMTKTAELAEVVEVTPRQAVREISLESHHGSLVWTAVGGAAGLLGGVMAGMALSESEANSCISSKCNHVGSVAALFGLPTAGALIGYFATRHESREVVYRAAGQ